MTKRRQQRQHSNSGLNGHTRIKGQKLRAMRSYTLEAAQMTNYRWLARHTGRGHGWLALVATGKGRPVPLAQDYERVKAVCLVLRSYGSKDDAIFQAALAVYEHEARLHKAVAHLVGLTANGKARTNGTAAERVA